MKIGQSIGEAFKSGPIAMGRDTRTSGNMIFSAVSSGIMSTGVDVIDLGILPTPALQFYCKSRGIYGVIITASHNPPEFNGIKCIDRDGTELGDEKEMEIEDVYLNSRWKTARLDSIGTMSPDPTAPDQYVKGIMSHIDVAAIRNMRFRVVVDSGNGASFHTTPTLLRKLGCQVVELNSFPDGHFTSRSSEPKQENLTDLMALMKTSRFNLGIAHDGDADRVVFIDENGNFIDGDRSLSLIVKYHAAKGDVVVTPVSSSDTLDVLAESNGFRLIRTRVGAPVVSRTLISNHGKIGGEENGGVIYGKHQYCRDGAMTAGLMLDLMARTGKPVSELVSELPHFFIFRSTVHSMNSSPSSVLGSLEGKLSDYRIDRTDGLKIYFQDGWVLVRASGTEPIIRIYGHAGSEKRAKELNRKVYDLMQK
jgi:phosphomannomutase/phosphoglucomutase